MGKHDSLVGFATAMGIVALFGTIAYFKGRNQQPKLNSFNANPDNFTPNLERKIADASEVHSPVWRAFYGEPKKGCGCGGAK